MREKISLKGLKVLECRQFILDWVDSCNGKFVNVYKKQVYPGFFNKLDVLNTYDTDLSVPISIEDGVYLVAGNTKLQTDIPFTFDEENTVVYASMDRLLFLLPEGYEGKKIVYIFDKVA